MGDLICCDLDDFLHAMASETRQRILALLCEQEMSVSELTELLPVTQPTISHHLGLLYRARLVKMRRMGKYRIYRGNQACVAECCSEIRDRFSNVIEEGDPWRLAEGNSCLPTKSDTE